MATEARPVPRPRRNVAAPGATTSASTITTVALDNEQQEGDQNRNYVNVSIEKEDKNKKKKKQDSSSSSSPSSSSSSTSSADEVDLRNNNYSMNMKNPYSSVIQEIGHYKSIADSPPEKEAIIAEKPKPAPRNRTKQNPPLQYENTEIRMSDNPMNNPEIVISSSTGAIKKQPTRLAPPRPPSPKIGNKSPVEMKKKESISSTTGEPSVLNRSSSSNTLDSSQDGSEQSAKYKTSSPGQILKNIGASSRLLTEAITERVSTKTKGARKKIVKTSKDTLFTLSSDATSTLKNVRNKFNTRLSNLSLGRATSKEEIPDLDRPMTLPPEGDPAFKGIQFNSPLGSKPKNSYDITDSTYEIPKKRHSALTSGSEMSFECPSYEEAVRSDSHLNESFSPLPNDFERNTGVTQSMVSSIGGERKKLLFEKEPQEPLLRRKSETNLEATPSPEVEIPCPNFPPPILSLSPVYGKITKKTVTISSDEEEDDHFVSLPPPPLRHRTKSKRQQHKDEEEARVCSNRATVDPNEYKREAKIYPRLDAMKLLPEKETSKCDSWSFYDAVSKDEILSPTKKEPTPPKEKPRAQSSYENVEPVYGTVFDEEKQGINAENILLEFDPLMGGSSDGDLMAQGGKSNHLLLLETLLSQETYGIIDSDDEDGNILGNTSDDDSLNFVLENAPTIPVRQESLTKPEEQKPSMSSSSKKASNEEKQSNQQRPVMIIHQNSNLRSDSMENIVDEAEMERYLVQTDENAAAASLPALPPPPVVLTEEVIRGEMNPSSAFYIDQNRPKSLVPPKKAEKKKETAENVPLEPPPSYQEVLKEKAEQEAVSTTKSTETINAHSSPTTSKKTSMISKFSNVFNRNIIRRSSLKSSNKPEVKTVLEMIPRPAPPAIPVDYKGHLMRYPTGVVEDILKETQSRHTAIRNHTFYTFLNSELKNPKESFPMEEVTTVQSIVNQKMTNGQMDVHCFEVTVEVLKSQHNQSQGASNPNLVLTATNSGNSKATRVCHVYGCIKQSERRDWMEKLLENMTSVFPRTATQDYKRAGWCYMKNSISANWSGAWLLLQQRRKLLFYHADKLDVLDLRKARCIVLKENDESINNLRVESGPILMIDCPPFTLYLIMNWPRETKIWRNIIREEAHNNGMSLKNQQLTKDNVPVLVDKCINFIYTHGSMSEGIYRKSGSENQVAKLLSSFKEDAFVVQLTRSEYSEHDVATALKRFMRDLPEPLLGKYTISFLAVSALKVVHDKFQSYAELLQRLPTIEYQTLRKLLGHLNFIQSQKAKNKMGTDNLSMLWGPTLLSDKTADQMKYSTAEATVMFDLISYYKNLFTPTKEELEKDAIMLTVLQKYHAAAENLSDSVKQSGDLKVWIHVDLLDGKKVDGEEEEENLQVSVTLTPTKTVHDVLRELRNKIKSEPYQCTLYEVILDGTLERPLHYTERLLDTVLRWTYWTDTDRKTNCLKIKSNKFLVDVERALKNMSTVHPLEEMRFADIKSKSIKSVWLELNKGSVNVLKREKNGEIKNVKAIELKHTIAFLGCEKKRESQSRWGITLIDKSFQKRTREAPFIGHLIAGDNFNYQTSWYSCILYSLYGNDLMPSPEILE